MIIPDEIVESCVTFKDQYFDLKGLSAYSSLVVPTLRDYVKEGKLPAFKIKGKVFIKRSEFDECLEKFRLKKKQDIMYDI